MSFKPVYDLVATNREGESVGYFIYARHQSPLSVVARKPQLTGAVLDRPTDAGGTYSVSEAAEWTAAAGFLPGRMIPLTAQSRLWVAGKPED